MEKHPNEWLTPFFYLKWCFYVVARNGRRPRVPVQEQVHVWGQSISECQMLAQLVDICWSHFDF